MSNDNGTSTGGVALYGEKVGGGVRGGGGGGVGGGREEE